MAGRYFSVLLLLSPAGLLISLTATLPGAISGQVVDPAGPVAGAVVRFKGDALAVVTDEAGRFVLPRAPAGKSRITAAKDGYFIAGAPASATPLVLHLEPLPAEDHDEYAWVDPRPDGAGRHNCANCHADIYREWAGSAHARSVSNPRFRDHYAILLKDNPDGAGVCTSCHAPGIPFGDPAYYELREATGVGAQGVHCDYCHKIAGPEPAARIGTTHGRFGLRLLRPEKHQLFFGTLDDVDRGDDAYSRFYRSSRYCASCHEGVVFGVHVYSTYSEWRASPAARRGQQCQGCHMAPNEARTNIAPGRGGLERDPRTLSTHGMFVGSQEAMLRRALNVSADVTRTKASVAVAVTLRTEDVGHRVPTGFIDRHLILVVEARHRTAPLAPIAGTILPELAGKEFAGSAGRLFARVLSDPKGRSPAPFWNARPTFEDTRLRPEQTEQHSFTFPPTADHVRIRLLYRRFWPDGAGKPADALTIVDMVR